MFFIIPDKSEAIPVFARKYNISCSSCHAAFPRLDECSFIGLDYIHNDHWLYSLLYNYADANDLTNTDTVYEGIDINSLTLSTSYYFMRNIKGVIEVNLDLLDTVDKTGVYWTGHLTGEDYVLIGFDAAF